LTLLSTLAFEARTPTSAAPPPPPKPEGQAGTDGAGDSHVSPECEAMRRDAKVEADTPVVGLDAERLRPKRRIRVVDSAGRPAGGVAIRFWSPRFRVTERSNPDGTLTESWRDQTLSYDVDAAAPPGLESPPARGRVHLTMIDPGNDEVVLRLPWTLHVVARGTIVDETGRPLARATVSGDAAPGSRAASASASTDDAGRFELTAWNEEPRLLRTSYGRHVHDRWIKEVGRDPSTEETRYQATHAVAGFVENGAGAVVTLRQGGRAEHTVVAGPDGAFVFDSPSPPAIWEVDAARDGWVAVPHDFVRIDMLDVRLDLVRPENVLHGVALDARGAPLKLAWVRIGSQTGMETKVLTDFDGRFAWFDANPGGSYDVSLLEPGPERVLVPGATVRGCRGSLKDIVLRASR
jgi:hypothetical protein